MKRNSSTLFLASSGATTSIPWSNGEPDLAGFTDPTLGVLQKAWTDFLASGEDLEIIADPELIELPPELNPAAFRAALAQTSSWLAWAETLPSVHYTNLTIAAAQGNWDEAQAIYNAIKGASTPPIAAVAAWQQLADASGIPITF